MSPFLHCGALMLPCRALPVPFCLQGFLPPPLLSARFLTFAVPWKIRARIHFKWTVCYEKSFLSLKNQFFVQVEVVSNWFYNEIKVTNSLSFSVVNYCNTRTHLINPTLQLNKQYFLYLTLLCTLLRQNNIFCNLQLYFLLSTRQQLCVKCQS